MKYLYKFKSATLRSDHKTSRDIEDLMADRLWASTYTQLNDPTDFPLYADENVPEEDIDNYSDIFCQRHCCISFSKTPSAKRLWNYYSNGMKGLVIAYRKDDIDAALTGMGIHYISGPVKYDGKKFNMTDEILHSEFEPANVDSFFHKEDSWEAEKEYRYVFPYDEHQPYHDKENGFHIVGLKPAHIFIGYRMAKVSKGILTDFCQSRDISLYEIKPNQKTPKNEYIRKMLVRKKDTPADLQSEFKAKLY